MSIDPQPLVLDDPVQRFVNCYESLKMKPYNSIVGKNSLDFSKITYMATPEINWEYYA